MTLSRNDRISPKKASPAKLFLIRNLDNHTYAGRYEREQEALARRSAMTVLYEGQRRQNKFQYSWSRFTNTIVPRKKIFDSLPPQPFLCNAKRAAENGRCPHEHQHTRIVCPNYCGG
jgi:ferredoxin-NADP reductase